MKKPPRKATPVDLSKVVSRYIGETEKNLDRVFQEAERTDAAPTFDESDELFAVKKRPKKP